MRRTRCAGSTARPKNRGRRARPGRGGARLTALRGITRPRVQKLERPHDAPNVVRMQLGGAFGVARAQRLPQRLRAVFLRERRPPRPHGVLHWLPFGKGVGVDGRADVEAGAPRQDAARAASVDSRKAAASVVAGRAPRNTARPGRERERERERSTRSRPWCGTRRSQAGPCPYLCPCRGTPAWSPRSPLPRPGGRQVPAPRRTPGRRRRHASDRRGECRHEDAPQVPAAASIPAAAPVETPLPAASPPRPAAPEGAFLDARSWTPVCRAALRAVLHNLPCARALRQKGARPPGLLRLATDHLAGQVPRPGLVDAHRTMRPARSDAETPSGRRAWTVWFFGLLPAMMASSRLEAPSTNTSTVVSTSRWFARNA